MAEGVDVGLMATGRAIDAQGRILSDTHALIERTESSREQVDAERARRSLAKLTEVTDQLSERVLVPMLRTGVDAAFDGETIGAVFDLLGKDIGAEVTQGVAAALAAQGGQGDLVSMMLDLLGGAGGAMFDSGGMASGKGLMRKGTIQPERVLSPRQTSAFEAALSGGFRPLDSGIGSKLLDTFAELVGVTIKMRDTITAVAKDIKGWRGEYETVVDAQGRMLSDTSALLERTGSSRENVKADRDAMFKELLAGTLVTIVTKVLIPALTAVLSALITAATTAIGAAIAGPVGALVGAAAGAALSGVAGIATAGLGGLLTSILGGGKFDEGGVATGMGLMPKGTIEPERVLSPRQTGAFERMVEALERGERPGNTVTIHAPFNVRGDRRGGEQVRDGLLALLD